MVNGQDAEDCCQAQSLYKADFLSKGCGHVLYMLTAYTLVKGSVIAFAIISTITIRDRRYQQHHRTWFGHICPYTLHAFNMCCIEYPVTSRYWAMIGPNAGNKDRLISLKDFVHRLSCCQTVLVGYCLNLKPEGQTKLQVTLKPLTLTMRLPKWCEKMWKYFFRFLFICSTEMILK